jgi:hypothetical protein
LNQLQSSLTQNETCATVSTKLTRSERSKLSKLESVIRQGVQTFYETGKALRAIRDANLYRQSYATFEDYCAERWGFVASRARQLIGASEVVSNLKSVTTVTPENERQARALVALPPERQAEVWQQIVKESKTEAITADQITRKIQDMGFDKRWGREATDEHYKRAREMDVQGYMEALGKMSPMQLEAVLRRCLPSIPGRVLFKAVDEARYMTAAEMTECNRQEWRA